MRKLTRLAIIGGASALALALSAPALAAFTPRLDVSVPNGLGASGKVTIHPAVGPTDDTTREARHLLADPLYGGRRHRRLCHRHCRRTRPGRRPRRCHRARARRDRGARAHRTTLVSGVQVPLAELAMQCTGTTTHHRLLGVQADRAGNALEWQRSSTSRPGRAGARHVEDHVLSASGRRSGGHARPLAARDQARGRGVGVQRRHLHEPLDSPVRISGRRSGRRTTPASGQPTSRAPCPRSRPLPCPSL